MFRQTPCIMSVGGHFVGVCFAIIVKVSVSHFVVYLCKTRQIGPWVLFDREQNS